MLYRLYDPRRGYISNTKNVFWHISHIYFLIWILSDFPTFSTWIFSIDSDLVYPLFFSEEGKTSSSILTGYPSVSVRLSLEVMMMIDTCPDWLSVRQRPGLAKLWWQLVALGVYIYGKNPPSQDQIPFWLNVVFFMGVFSYTYFTPALSSHQLIFS